MGYQVIKQCKYCDYADLIDNICIISGKQLYYKGKYKICDNYRDDEYITNATPPKEAKRCK